MLILSAWGIDWLNLLVKFERNPADALAQISLQHGGPTNNGSACLTILL